MANEAGRFQALTAPNFRGISAPQLDFRTFSFAPIQDALQQNYDNSQKALALDSEIAHNRSLEKVAETKLQMEQDAIARARQRQAEEDLAAEYFAKFVSGASQNKILAGAFFEDLAKKGGRAGTLAKNKAAEYAAAKGWDISTPLAANNDIIKATDSRDLSSDIQTSENVLQSLRAKLQSVNGQTVEDIDKQMLWGDKEYINEFSKMVDPKNENSAQVAAMYKGASAQIRSILGQNVPEYFVASLIFNSLDPGQNWVSRHISKDDWDLAMDRLVTKANDFKVVDDVGALASNWVTQLKSQLTLNKLAKEAKSAYDNAQNAALVNEQAILRAVDLGQITPEMGQRLIKTYYGKASEILDLYRNYTGKNARDLAEAAKLAAKPAEDKYTVYLNSKERQVRENAKQYKNMFDGT